ncbi:MAG: glycoside hydrolase [Hyphomicrobiales bacterium]|nr:glycoside hydrolase [Hyphomicrobiales bacterium]
MARKVQVLVGTRKGAFIFESDAARRAWSRRGPFCETWPIHHFIADPSDGTLYGAGGNAWFGPAVWKSTDQGASWTHSSTGLAYAEGQPGISAVWSLAAAHGRLYAGVEPAGLFASDDGGETFAPLPALNDHPTRPQWNPGGAGMILHHIVPNPDDAQELWVAISAAGVFYTCDGGNSFSPRNKGTRADFAPEGQREPEVGQCVHGLALAPGGRGRLYQQNHCGMYRSDDGGAQWHSIEAGLPSSFGFPAVAHPRDPERLFMFPLNGADQGRFPVGGHAALWTSSNAGSSWRACSNGLPDDAYFGVLRQAMAADRLEPAGIYIGASNGTLFASADEGESFMTLAENLPVISSIETHAFDG